MTHASSLDRRQLLSTAAIGIAALAHRKSVSRHRG